MQFSFVHWHIGDGATSHLETGGFIRSAPGVEHPDIQFHFLPSQVIDHGRVSPKIEAYQVSRLQSLSDCTLINHVLAAFTSNIYIN